MRPEAAADTEALDAVAMACSPVAGLLPAAMLREQAALQRIGEATAYPAAMRRVVLRAGRVSGRLAIDWAPMGSRCIDVALLSELRGRGVGTALLGAWLAVADRLGLPTALSVRRDNPALALYRRLGFVEDGATAGPLLAMSRPR